MLPVARRYRVGDTVPGGCYGAADECSFANPRHSHWSGAAGTAGGAGSGWLQEWEKCRSSLSRVNWQGQAGRGDGMAELAVMEREAGGLGMQGRRELCRQKCQTSAVIEIK